MEDTRSKSNASRDAFGMPRPSGSRQNGVQCESSAEPLVEVGDNDSPAVPVALVTGASGYIASHIVQQILKAGKVRVRGTVRSLKNEPKVVPLLEMVPDARYPLELVEAELLDENCWTEALKGVTYVYHVASPVLVLEEEETLVRQSVEGTLNVLKACVAAGTVKGFVYTSSFYAACIGVISMILTMCTQSLIGLMSCCVMGMRRVSSSVRELSWISYRN